MTSERARIPLSINYSMHNAVMREMRIEYGKGTGEFFLPRFMLKLLREAITARRDARDKQA